MIRYLRLVANVSNWWLHFAVKTGLTSEDPLLFKTRNRIQIEVPRRLHHEFKEIFMEASYTIGLAAKIPKAPTIVDIGANVGFFSLFAASRFPGASIFAYEPVPRNFDQLVRNRELNQKAEITCVPKAVYGFSGLVNLEIDPADTFTTSARVAAVPTQASSTIEVPCTALSDLLDAHGIEACHLLKIDCEGAEFDILYSCPEAYLQRIEQMVIEVHRGATPERTIEHLSRFLESRCFSTRRSHNMLWVWNAGTSQYRH